MYTCILLVTKVCHSAGALSREFHFCNIFKSHEIGLYSIILEVADAAGNIAKARSLLLYDNSSVIEVLDENPLSISGAHLVGSNYWIVNPQPSLSISWNNR